MPLTGFICPDGGRILVSNCLAEGGCRMGTRCATRSYLRLVSSERKWTGKPSTTQLIRGTMQSFLLLTCDYYTSPDSRAFMVNGTKGHGTLEASEDDLSFLEERFDSPDDDESGIADVIEIENETTILADYKLSGSYKVAKALGFRVVEKETDEIFKSGKRKGEKKTKKELVRDDSYIDRREWGLQLNKYRVALEKRGFLADKLKIQVIVRDGGTFIARSRGVFRNVYYFNIDKIPNSEVVEYFDKKRTALFRCLADGNCNEICSGEENWDGLRCQKYCDVAESCRYGKYLKAQKQSEDEMIKGLSEVRRLPRLGKIRLGIKRTASSGKEYPVEINYFRLDPKTPSETENKNLIDEFQRLYGKEPKRIKIMFPLPDSNVFFPQFYKRYGNGVLRCKGDGTEADCISKEYATGIKILGENEIGGIRVECLGNNCPAYKSKHCSESASLSILLPEIKGAGVWEINTGSLHSIINVNSCIEYVRALAGRCHMIPLVLERREQEITHDGKKSKHYILHVSMDVALADLQRYALIDATKIMLELPSPETDKEDILFQENKLSVVDADVVDQPENKPTPAQEPAPAPREPHPFDTMDGTAIGAVIKKQLEARKDGMNWDTFKSALLDKYKTKLTEAFKTHGIEIESDVTAGKYDSELPF